MVGLVSLFGAVDPLDHYLEAAGRLGDGSDRAGDRGDTERLLDGDRDAGTRGNRSEELEEVGGRSRQRLRFVRRAAAKEGEEAHILHMRTHTPPS